MKRKYRHQVHVSIYMYKHKLFLWIFIILILCVLILYMNFNVFNHIFTFLSANLSTSLPFITKDSPVTISSKPPSLTALFENHPKKVKYFIL